MKVYFISGLAADSRVFKHIQLPSQHEMIHLDWITPEKNESLSSYATRLSQKIDSTAPFALVGLSMGGMMAAEIAKLRQPAITVLLSSVPVNKHLPFYFKWLSAIRLHKVVPIGLLKQMSVLKRGLTPDTIEDKAVLKQVIMDSDPHFIRWAMQAILSWKNDGLPDPYIHIHGSKDEILPVKYTNPTHIIKGGNHLMIMSRAKELNEILKGLFNRL